MITISKKICNILVSHAINVYPNEACGILAGPPQNAVDGKNWQAAEFFPMRNMDLSSISYFMDPREQLQVFKRIRELKLEMRGIFHSHVASEAYPSQKDVRLAFYPDVSYLILSLSDRDNPDLRSFQIQDEKVQEEEIKIV